MNVLNDEKLNIMWDIATNSSLESGTPPHQIFAKLLYNKITKSQVRNESQSSIRPTS